MHHSGAVPPTHLIGTAEAARLLGVSRWTIARRVRNGQLRPYRQMLGPTGAYLFDPADILACLIDDQEEAS